MIKLPVSAAAAITAALAFAACAPNGALVTGPGAVAGTADDFMFPEDTPAELEVVGRAPVTHTHTSELWAFTGRDGSDYVYTGTWGGCPGCIGDRIYVWNVDDASSPALIDSVMVDARIINDIMVNEDASLAVFTREGASNRRNGIVILDITNPASPSIRSEFTETVTGGVHVIYIWNDHVFLTNNGTGDMHVINIENPDSPHEVGRWGVNTPGRYLHDVWVDDGLAYLSYWDDGMVVLDVGNGRWGGSPDNPVKVSQLTYTTRWRGRTYGNTHQAIPYTNRAGNSYIFVGDEIFPDTWSGDIRGMVPGGYIHVVDATDIENPRIVGRYEVEGAGTHNMWFDDQDRMYVAYYNAGVRVVDISGELEGDLRAQGRELAVLNTGAEDAFIENQPFAWSPRLHNGLLYISDMNSGLWVTRLRE